MPEVYTSIIDVDVAPDAGIDDYFDQGLRGNLNYLKSALSDGLVASQDLDTNNVTANGDMQVDEGVLLGHQVLGNAIAFSSTTDPTLSAHLKDNCSVEGFGINASGVQFAPDLGDITWGYLVAISLAFGIARGPMLKNAQEEF
jgi:hypothetical protein